MSQKGLCLVLGANGFIGSHLVDELVAAGYAVRAFDRGSSPAKYQETQDVETVSGDIYDTEMLKTQLKGVDYVFHCFSATTPFTSDNDPMTDIDLNLKPSVTIFSLCHEAGVKKVIYLSSGGAIYGHVAEEHAVTENDVPTPVSPYGVVKLAVEGYLAYFNRKFDLPYVAYRLTNPYGTRQAFNNNQGVIPAFLSQIKEFGHVKVMGDGTASRDFIYIRDATKMIVNSFAKDTKYPIYNIGSGKQSTVNDIVSSMQAALGEKFEVMYSEAPKTFLKTTNISIERYASEFGMPELMPLEEGIKQTIATGYKS